MELPTAEEIVTLEKSLITLGNLHSSFDYLKVCIASPEKIKGWAIRKLPQPNDDYFIGEVKQAETLNFRTLRPENEGLFCEVIFGPLKDWECRCGAYSGYNAFTNTKVCPNCFVEITEARVRRYRMGYVPLSSAVMHCWYLKGIPNYLMLLLRCLKRFEDLKYKHIDEIVYFRRGGGGNIIVPEIDRKTGKDITNPFIHFLYKCPDSALYFYQSYREPFSKLPERRIGCEIIQAALQSLNMRREIKTRKAIIDRLIVEDSIPPSREKILKVKKKEREKKFIPRNKPLWEKTKAHVKSLRVLESFLATKTDPSWMVLTVLPVMPPNLRPLMELDNGKLVSADVNEIYRLLIIRNKRLFDLVYKHGMPELIATHGRRLLQEVVDCLIDNSRLPKSKTMVINKRPLKSLSEILEGKFGRFRQSLLGKRVDYSGRSVIIVGPTLRLNQCGLPYDMAVELFEPFIVHELFKTKIKPPTANFLLAKKIIKRRKPFIWTLLETITKKHCILLNRAPTLHRFGIQSFDPVMILGQAIHLHPLVCTGFNADFDGDQMAVHIPLYEASQLEAKSMMRPSYNVLSPANGEVILKPTQDMVIGSYYLTLVLPIYQNLIQKCFANEKDVLSAFYQKVIDIHTRIFVRYSLIDFTISIEKGEFLISDKFLSIGERKIIIYKTFQFGNKIGRKYFLTNAGIFIGRLILEDKYEITDFFLETTPGRLIFSVNIKRILEHSLKKN